MKNAKLTTLAAAIFMSFSVQGASAGTCNIVANHVTGNGNFVDLDVSGCGYTSNHMRGSFSFAEIINRLGRVVAGIYGNGHYYAVHNIGDNEIGIKVDGVWHRTKVTMKGNDNVLDLVQKGAPSNVVVNGNGSGNHVKIRTR